MSPSSSPTAWSSAERAAISDTFQAVGPDAPTLCEGWTARDLVAHLVVRERRLDALPGIGLPAFAGWTAKLQGRIAARPYDEVVAELRDGPPAWSIWRFPSGQGLPTLLELLVHHEDLLRAQPGWEPRTLDPRVEDTVWKALTRLGRGLYRRSPVGVVLQRGPGVGARVKAGDATVTVSGPPVEQLLYAFGRGSHAQVEVDGDTASLAAFRETRLGA